MDDQVPQPSTLTPAPDAPGAHLCVLASGSSGNCSVLALRRAGSSIVRYLLIDLGLSPRRTIKLLADAGIGLHQLDGALVTHLDHDHLHAGWRRHMPEHARVWLHDRHADRLPRHDRDRWRLTPFADEFSVDEGVRVRPILLSHDELGVASFRIDFSEGFGGSSLGFATDLGRVPVELLDLFGRRTSAGPGHADQPVDVLAIESNYCPVLQRASTRPEVLKQRIMGGRGHLSNQEAVSAILHIEPREHVVLLHLSRECNSAEIVSSLHAGADYALTITSQHQPSRWVRIGGNPRSPGSGAGPTMPRTTAVTVQPMLWNVGATP